MVRVLVPIDSDACPVICDDASVCLLLLVAACTLFLLRRLHHGAVRLYRCAR
jgi:hypothetical protein